MSKTVIQHVLGRLRDLGVAHVFGVPGDFAFPVNDAIVNQGGLEWVGCCNELNAGYAADGYARVRGVGALCTTYGVGELSALAAIGGSYAEHLPIIHLVGMPNMKLQLARALMHHTLGNGEYDLFARMSEPVVAARAVLTPQNAAAETERVIAAALYHRRPVYLGFPGDQANEPILADAEPHEAPRSNETHLAAAVDAIASRLKQAGRACVLPGILVARLQLAPALQAVIDASGLPFATMFMDKTVLDEQHPSYLGMYDGTLMNPIVGAAVEACDAVLAVGTLLTDFNTGAFTAKLDPAKTMTVAHHHVRVGERIYANVEMHDVLARLALVLKGDERRPTTIVSAAPAAAGSGDDPITVPALYPRLEAFLREDDLVVAETGTISMGVGFARMPARATFYNQTLWGAIGWATPAAFGAAVAAPTRRTILMTGEGAHQLTVQEISQFGRRGLRPIILVLNNDGYLIERLLCADPETSYNDLAAWRYADLPRAFGCDDWFTVRVETCGELDGALAAAATATTGVYIEIVTGRNEASPLAAQLGTMLKRAYAEAVS